MGQGLKCTNRKYVSSMSRKLRRKICQDIAVDKRFWIKTQKLKPQKKK